MAWLQGGPLLEVSFIIEEIDIKSIISNLKTLPDVSLIEEDISDKENLFEVGYKYDEDDPSSYRIHSINLNLFVEINGKRKSVLLISKVATETILIDFCFYGSEIDAHEWNQKGIQEGEYKYFVNFLSSLLDHFQGIIGTVAIEKDVLELISLEHTYPNEIYRYDKIDQIDLLKKNEQNNSFIAVGYRLEETIIMKCL
ncbi:hypothetical protein ACXFAU_11955 [Paenibacillus glucanolyticus]